MILSVVVLALRLIVTLRFPPDVPIVINNATGQQIRDSQKIYIILKSRCYSGSYKESIDL